MYEKADLLRNHGQKKKYIHETVGYNSRLDSIQASILNLKLKDHEAFLNQNLKVINKYIPPATINTSIGLKVVEIIYFATPVKSIKVTVLANDVPFIINIISLP